MVVRTVSRYIERGDEIFDDNDNYEKLDNTRSANRSAVRLGSNVGHPNAASHVDHSPLTFIQVNSFFTISMFS